jgi:hypothetical protein
MFDLLIQREEARALFFKEAIEKLEDRQGGFEELFGNKQFSKLYPDLSKGAFLLEGFSGDLNKKETLLNSFQNDRVSYYNLIFILLNSFHLTFLALHSLN